MTDIIPHLRDLCFRGNAYKVDPEFVESFVRLHNENWRAAQSHWEDVVELVLETDAVDEGATGGLAIRQAVKATMALFKRTDLHTKCPICARNRRSRTSGEGDRA